jgi:hypothetical protein
MSLENLLWGAPRIRSELLLLGYDVAEATVAKYMTRRGRRPPSQTWRTFLRNHLRTTAACDFFVVPTATFQLLFCFVVLTHDRRRILHLNVTARPTAAWAAQQIREAFPGDGTEPRYLLRDRDGAYGDECRRVVRAIGIREILTAPQGPVVALPAPHEVPVFVARSASVPSPPRLPAVASTQAPLGEDRGPHEHVAVGLTRLVPAGRNFR